ncbi:MAG: exopolysaccharide biosynthesis polyprenyl glycosylphosphotransferase [Actinomycetota bacterium]
MTDVRVAPPHAPAWLGSRPLGLRGHRLASWLLLMLTSCGVVVAGAVWSLQAPSVSLGLGLGVALLVVSVLFLRGVYRVQTVPRASSAALPVLESVAIAAGIALLLLGLLPTGRPTYEGFGGLALWLGAWAFGLYAAGLSALRALWRRGHLRSRALVYGVDPLVREMEVELSLRPEYGLDLVGFVADPAAADASSLPAPLYSVHGDVVLALADSEADRLIVGPATDASDRDAVRIARRAAALGVPVFVVPRFFQMGLGSSVLSNDQARGYPLVRLQRSAHPQVSRRLKRMFDLVVAGSLLVLLTPVLVVVAGLVKASSPGPALFRQNRIGQHGRPIVIHKFRSMRLSPTSDIEWTAEGRVTKVGQWIRRVNLDELPQLYTIAKGEMSLVGPRPERPAFVDRFSLEIDGYADRHRAPVGVTGLAQVVGLRGDTSIEERVKYDNLYIDQWSFRSDLLILIRTIPAIFGQARAARRYVELGRAIKGGRGKMSPAAQISHSGHPAGDEGLGRTDHLAKLES